MHSSEWPNRTLKSRDKGCRFPGCTHKRFVDAHHIEHWAAGGETKLGNLVQLCRTHHRMVHEGGVGLTIDKKGTLIFTRADGAVLEAGPQLPAAHPDALQRTHEQLGLRIDHKTGVPHVTDMVMDYDMGVMGLLRRDGRLYPSFEPKWDR